MMLLLFKKSIAMSEGTEAACSHGLIQTNQSDPTPTQPAVIPALLHEIRQLFIYFFYLYPVTHFVFLFCVRAHHWLGGL